VPRREYHWEEGDEPPRIEAHSLAKHQVLREYLLTYVDVLTRNVRREVLRLTLVDGFSGGGLYCDGEGRVQPGSPLLMLDAMKEAEATAQSRRNKPFRLESKFFFVEKIPRVRSYLESVLRERGFGPRIGNDLVLLGGEFETHVAGIIDDVKKRGSARRTIFLLDQYGYSDVPLPVLRKIFSELPNAEVLLTIATDWLIDYMSTEAAYKRTLVTMGLEGFISDLPTLLEKKGSAEWRALAQVSLHRDLREHSGATHFTPFFIVSEAAHRDYWLVHLSNHAKARDEMAKLHWALENRFSHYAGHGLDMLGYKAGDDPLVTGQGAFSFDTQARSSTEAALLRDIPEVLNRLPDGITFNDFFSAHCNDTPASSEILAEVVQQLAIAGAVEVHSDTGQRRPGSSVQPGDVLRLPRQLFIDLGDSCGRRSRDGTGGEEPV